MISLNEEEVRVYTRYSCLIVFSACLFARPQPSPAVRDARELSMTKTVNEAGNITIRLRNEYSAPATAWIVECHGESDPGPQWVSRWHWSETDFGLDPKPLDPGKETEVVIRKPMSIANSKFGQQPRGTCDNFHVIAAVFADGTVSGDLSWINAIMNERRKVYQDIAKATEMLNKAVANKTDPSAVVKQFEEWWQAERPGRMAPAKTGYGVAFGSSWQGARPGQPLVPKMPPRAGTSPRAAVPGVTLSLIQKEGTSLPETIKLLAAWRERLGQIKAVTEAAGPDSSADLPRRARLPVPDLPPEPDLVGKPAPDFTLKDVDGREVALRDLRGKSVLLTFWATWCEPCRKELPQIEALYKALKDKGLVVLAVNVNESAETAKKFFAEQGYTFQCLIDPAGEANKQYGAGGGIPRTILIDKDGIVRDFQSGFGPQVDLSAKVKKLGLDAPTGTLPPVTGAQGQDLQQQMALNGIQILPNMADRAITNFNFPHTIYVNREIVVSHKPDLAADRHQLLLFIPGTHVPGGPRGAKGPFQFLQLAANLGYHVINLTYPDETAAAQVCNNDKDPLAFESFRMSIIAGGSSPHIEVSRTDSIENRLIKLLLLLKQIRPKEHWEEFLNEGGGIKWESIVVAGQSQGGGHAALIAIKHRVARVICTGAPKDYSHALNKPAAWYREASGTPKGRFFAFNHLQDRMGDCSLKQQMENLKALGLDEFGAADVDTDKPPYRHARILTTNYPGGQVSSGEAHTSVIANEGFKDVWSYMLTEPVQ